MVKPTSRLPTLGSETGSETPFFLGDRSGYSTPVTFTNTVFPCAERLPNAAVPRW